MKESDILTLPIDRGQPFKRVFAFKDKSKNPIEALNLAGFAARLQMRQGPSERSVLLLDLDSTLDPELLLDGEKGTVTVELDRALTNSLPAGRWAYELEIAVPDSEAECILIGGKAVVTDGVIVLDEEVIP